MQGPVIPTGRRRRTAGRGGESVLRADEPPIYAELAERWRQAGRMLPGQDDREWSELVSRVPDLGLTSGQAVSLNSDVVPLPA